MKKISKKHFLIKRLIFFKKRKQKMKKMTISERKYCEVWQRAYLAGTETGQRHNPTPMVVGTETTLFNVKLDTTKTMYHVPDGLCGFAWVTIYPGNCAFANWLKKMRYASPAYQGGVQIPIREYGQSYEKKYAHAKALAAVLNLELPELGNRAYADSRLD
jgi:hypothetical protein